MGVGVAEQVVPLGTGFMRGPGAPPAQPYLDLALGTVSTPDTPDMSLLNAGGSMRVQAILRIDTQTGIANFPGVVTKQGGGGVPQREYQLYYSGADGRAYGTVVDAALTTSINISISPTGPPALGALHSIGFECAKGMTAAVAMLNGARTPVTLSALPGLPDTTAAVVIGGVLAGFTGRLFAAEAEAINQAQLVFPGTSGAYLSTPDAAALDITGDIEFVARVAPDTWRPTTNYEIISKYNVTGNQRSYRLMLGTSGTLFIYASNDGTSPPGGATSTVIPDDGAPRWIKATRVASTGAVAFYIAPDGPGEPTSWTAWGTSPGSNTGNIFVSTSNVWVGAREGNADWFKGRIPRAIVRNGIGGTTVLDVSENNAGVRTGNTFVASSGQTVTINGDVSVVPQPDVVVWQFNANDYPGSGTSYVDPRGRTWTLSAAGVIVKP